MELLPLEITSQLPFRFFNVGGTSEAFLDQVRATEGNLQVQPCPDISGFRVGGGGVFLGDCFMFFVWGGDKLFSLTLLDRPLPPSVDVCAGPCSRKVSAQDAGQSRRRGRAKSHAKIYPVCEESECGDEVAWLEVQPRDSHLHPVRRRVEDHLHGWARRGER